MTLYYVSTDRGCGIRAARNEDAAYRAECREVGENHVSDCRPATQADLDWVRGMNGHVPKGEIEP